MASSTLAQPYTTRCAPADGPPLKDFCNATPDVQQLYLTSHFTGAMAIVEDDMRLTMHVAPYIKKENGKLTEILLNISNTELTPTAAGLDSAQFFAILVSCRATGDFSTKGLN